MYFCYITFLLCYNCIMKKTRKNGLILSIFLEAVIIIIAFLFWPNSTKIKQSNKLDREKTQIQIKTKRLNIRENPSTDSTDIGDVYEGEIYSVISHEDKEDYYWYHIKTENGIDGYIASSPDSPYVDVISGYVDRTPPTIYFNDDFIEILNDQYLFDTVTCEDDYSSCHLSYTVDNPQYALFTAVDDDGNSTSKEIKYYKVYSLFSEYYDNRSDINAKFTKSINGDTYLINATFILNKEIKSGDKSISYLPFIELFDEHFNIIDDIFVSYNSNNISDGCLNNINNVLKDEYLDVNLIKGNYLCMNYKFDNLYKKVKYIAVGFNGIENYNNPNNILSSYYSKFFILDS